MTNYDESLDSREALEYAFERLLTNYSCSHTKVAQFIYALEDAFRGRVRLVFIGELSLCLRTSGVDYFVSIAKNQYDETLYDRIDYELSKIGDPTPEQVQAGLDDEYRSVREAWAQRIKNTNIETRNGHSHY